MFIDRARLVVRGGDGGRGVISFRREAHVPRGGPDGGDGGKGGDVILRVDAQLGTLTDFRFTKQIDADAGRPGSGRNSSGRSGADRILSVPPGTLVIDRATGETVADLTAPGEELVVARGGSGGKGNARFATSTRRTPRIAEDGGKGEHREIELELKLLADVGLAGLPNAGKSTLLAALTSARPKIADYPFTTLVPNLGVARLDDRELVVADIPGLIEGASRGLGLGEEFLRHVERTRLLVHVVDASRSDPLQDIATIDAELKSYAHSGQRRATPSASGRSRWSGAKGGRTSEQRWHFRRHVRSGARRASRYRERGARRARTRARLLRSGAPLSIEAGWADRRSQGSPRDADRRDRGRTALSRIGPRAGSAGTVLHGRHARSAARRGRAFPDPRQRRICRFRKMARARADPQPRHHRARGTAWRTECTQRRTHAGLAAHGHQLA